MFFLVSMAFYGWDKVKGSVLNWTLVSTVVAVAVAVPRDYMSTSLEYDKDLSTFLYALYYLALVPSMFHRFMAPSEHGWRKTLLPMIVSQG